MSAVTSQDPTTGLIPMSKTEQQEDIVEETTALPVPTPQLGSFPSENTPTPIVKDAEKAQPTVHQRKFVPSCPNPLNWLRVIPLAIPVILMGALVLIFFGGIGAAIILVGFSVFKNSSDIIFDKRIALIGAVGAAVCTVGSPIITVPTLLFGLKVYSVCLGVLFLVSLFFVGPIGAAIVHRFSFALQTSVGQATKFSVVGYIVFILLIGSFVAGMITLFKKLG